MKIRPFEPDVCCSAALKTARGKDVGLLTVQFLLNSVTVKALDCRKRMALIKQQLIYISGSVSHSANYVSVCAEEDINDNLRENSFTWTAVSKLVAGPLEPWCVLHT